MSVRQHNMTFLLQIRSSFLFYCNDPVSFLKNEERKIDFVDEEERNT